MLLWNRLFPEGEAPGRLDPNYLSEGDFAASPFHCALHAWARALPKLLTNSHSGIRYQQ